MLVVISDVPIIKYASVKWMQITIIESAIEYSNNFLVLSKVLVKHFFTIIIITGNID